MWRVDQSMGFWNSPRLQAHVALEQPALGIHRMACFDAPWADAHLMQVAWPAQTKCESARVDDVYARGSDLIVTYAETAQSPIRPQVYWRIIDQPLVSPGIVIEVLASVQTQSLDADPRMRLATTIPGCTWHCCPANNATRNFQPMAVDASAPHRVSVVSPATALLARLPTGPCSCGQIVFSADLVDAQITTGQRDPRISILETTHFAARLEKGVLRRIRSRAILVPRAHDEQLVADLLRESATITPPLVT